MESSAWGTAGWWIIVAISVPFAMYASVFVYGDFDVYRHMTLRWAAKEYDVAGRNILEHIRLWQVHSFGAILFVILGAFQFNRPFRKLHPTAHRRTGYGFVAVATAMSIAGLFMVRYSDFGIVSRAVFFCQGLAMPLLLFMGVWMARQKKFQTHQKFMIRGAATGYAVMGVRIFLFLLSAAGVELWLSSDLAAILSVVVFVGLPEIYIQMVLSIKPALPPVYTKEETRKLIDHDPSTLNSVDVPPNLPTS